MKIIALIRGESSESYSDFGKRMHELSMEAGAKFSPEALSMTITETPPPVMSVIPFRKGKIAAISVRTEHPENICSFLQVNGFSGMYLAEEALPVRYQRNWENGKVTPGICLLTLFRQRKDISADQFLDRWHNSHTPLSLRIHPLWHYNRNVVKPYQIRENELIWDGIVEEHFRSSSDLLNPFRFFGNPWVILPRMLEVYKDTNRFLDYKTIQPWLVREYHYL